MHELAKKIFIEGGKKWFYYFSNQDGKYWIIPSRNAAIAFNLYQPSAYKGKFVKRFFPVLRNLRLFNSVLNLKQIKLELSAPLKKIIEDRFQISNPEFAVFGGTPSVHQKITLQISSGKRILGYCKVTDKEEIKSVFLHEQMILDKLKNTGMKQIPECLFCGSIQESLYIFVQTTVKTINSKTLHNWNNIHWAFLENLHSRTRQTLPFEQTGFCQMLGRFSSYFEDLPQNYAPVINLALKKVQENYAGGEVVFSTYHADFTPWNMFVEKGRLFVFDWEYAQSGYPPYLDYFHFFTQTAIFEKRKTCEKIFKTYQQRKKELSNYITNPDLLYQCYLLSVIELYLSRDKEMFNHSAYSNIKIWLQLLTYFS